MSEWISVKDRLPEPFTMVLAYCTNGRIHTVGYIDKFMTHDTVTYWMPLPEPPERENDAEWVDNKCSNCEKGIENLIDSREWYESEKPNYCPFCGAKFD